MGRSDLEVVARFLYACSCWNDRLRRAGITFDWSEV